MKLFLPFQVKEIGGTSTFARKFKAGMEAAGHEVTFDPSADYDILFLIVQCPLKYLIDAKRRKKKIVQRLDGTYYWSVSGGKFPLMNAKAAYIRHFFTDFTIYQSHYSQDSANRFLGRKRHDAHAIIYNGVDLRVFSPEGPKALQPDTPEQVFFTASAFRRLDQIMPILDGLAYYHDHHNSSFKFVVAGTFTGKARLALPRLESLPWVKKIGKIANADLPAYLRSADVFLFTHLNPPCPNNIIEALACGVPVCGLNDGAMKELIEEGTGELLLVTGSGYWLKRHFDPRGFADNIAAVLNNQQERRKRSRDVATARFSLDRMVECYVQVFERLCGQ